jgi:hypothetical protein
VELAKSFELRASFDMLRVMRRHGEAGTRGIGEKSELRSQNAEVIFYNS